METHVHHQHPDGHQHSGKKFRHYFYEFLMLFIAVTAGFYAENLREDIKNKREIETNMRSILHDLKADVAYTDSVIMRNDYSCTMADSLISMLHDYRTNSSEIYYLARTVTANFGYIFTNSKTYDQMKNSGALKLIEPRNLLDSLGTYYVTFQWLSNQTELMRLKIDEIHAGNEEVFDAFVFQKMMHIDYGNFTGGVLQIRRPEGNPKLLSEDPDKINKVALRYHYFYSTTKFYDRTAFIERQRASRLIEMISKEYNIE